MGNTHSEEGEDDLENQEMVKDIQYDDMILFDCKFFNL